MVTVNMRGLSASCVSRIRIIICGRFWLMQAFHVDVKKDLRQVRISEAFRPICCVCVGTAVSVQVVLDKCHRAGRSSLLGGSFSA